ncbi:LexA family transcriptional regulator [Xenophilus sp. Marseille-Q4582]|uniref:LexA family protein n=1 Tax=Xenophilus sp. Marseille-Q4582 TaxID=2866600 RepID=UPI001CE4767A|nr:translesion error-prone DNA polymerase V autoproteolytic subunit [Xenophilus sp. Marseille-Q4582]
MQPHSSTPRHGGSRQGAGRKAAYGEPTKTVRVPHSLVPVVAGYLAAMKRPPGGVVDGAGLQPIATFRTATAVSVLGRRVRAGKPTSGDDYQEDAVDLGKHLVRDPSSTFLMKVAGWSMRDAGIADGDELVVDRGVAAEDGRIVIADIDGELTVKRLRRTATGWLLEASNPEFADVPVGDKNDLHIWGVVTHVLRAV